MATDPGFNFDYTRYNPPGLTTQQLDDMYAKMVDPNGTTGTVMIIWTGIKMAFAALYLWARTKSVDIQYSIEEQAYLVKRAADNQGEVDNEEPPPIPAKP